MVKGVAYQPFRSSKDPDPSTPPSVSTKFRAVFRPILDPPRIPATFHPLLDPTPSPISTFHPLPAPTPPRVRSRFHPIPDPTSPPAVPPKPPSRRRSLSNRARQLLEKICSGDDAAGQRSVDDIGSSMRGIWSRSGSSSPDTRNHDHRTRDGDTIFSPVSADASWEYGEKRVNTVWGFGRDKVQISDIPVSSKEDLNGGLLLQDNARGRSRRRDATYSSPAPPAPHPEPGFRPSLIPKSPVSPEPPTGKPLEATAGKVLRKPQPWNRRPKILFCNKDEPYYGFVNSSPHPVDYRGKKYPTTEHLFQSFKVGGGIRWQRCSSSLNLSALAVLT
jgi:hypothetical protein